MDVFTMCDERLPVRARLPESRALPLFAGGTAKIKIPLEMAVRVRGIVRAKDTGKPLGGVSLSVGYGVGGQGDQAVTDENGKFSACALPGPVHVHLIGLPDAYVQLGEPWDERRTVTADQKDYEWPTIEVVRSFKIPGKLVDAEGKPMPNMGISGASGNRRYGFGNTNENGDFTLSGVPKEIQLEKFDIWTRDEQFTGVAESTTPLIVRLKK
jgi:hypothetical protein